MNLHFGSTVDTSGRNCLTELFPRLLYAHQFSMLQYPNTQESNFSTTFYNINFYSKTHVCSIKTWKYEQYQWVILQIDYVSRVCVTALSYHQQIITRKTTTALIV